MHELTGILLLGPTGSGKSPLGDWLERHGVDRRRCRHFDFGAQLRATQGPAGPSFLSREEIGWIGAMLSRAALLEDAQFSIALRILEHFAAVNDMREGDVVVLNGLPRHVGQAVALDGAVRMERVVALRCVAEVVLERIRVNAGGDREDRHDDTPDDIRRKLRLYAERTEPLVAHYRALGVRVDAVDVGVRTQPDDIGRAISVGRYSAPDPSA